MQIDPGVIAGLSGLVAAVGALIALVLNVMRTADRFKAQGIKEGQTTEQINTLNREVRDLKASHEDQATANTNIMTMLGKIDARIESIGQRLQRIEDKEDRAC